MNSLPIKEVSKMGQAGIAPTSEVFMVKLPVATSKHHAGQPQILLSSAPMIIAANRSEVVPWIKKLSL